MAAPASASLQVSSEATTARCRLAALCKGSPVICDWNVGLQVLLSSPPACADCPPGHQHLASTQYTASRLHDAITGDPLLSTGLPRTEELLRDACRALRHVIVRDGPNMLTTRVLWLLPDGTPSLQPCEGATPLPYKLTAPLILWGPSSDEAGCGRSPADDTSWTGRLVRYYNKHIALLSANAFISTLGGGRFLTRNMREAVKLALLQMQVAAQLQNDGLRARSAVHLVYCLLQLGDFAGARGLAGHLSAFAMWGSSRGENRGQWRAWLQRERSKGRGGSRKRRSCAETASASSFSPELAQDPVLLSMCSSAVHFIDKAEQLHQRGLLTAAQEKEQFSEATAAADASAGGAVVAGGTEAKAAAAAADGGAEGHKRGAAGASSSAAGAGAGPGDVEVEADASVATEAAQLQSLERTLQRAAAGDGSRTAAAGPDCDYFTAQARKRRWKRMLGEMSEQHRAPAGGAAGRAAAGAAASSGTVAAAQAGAETLLSTTSASSAASEPASGACASSPSALLPATAPPATLSPAAAPPAAAAASEGKATLVLHAEPDEYYRQRLVSRQGIDTQALVRLLKAAF